MTSVYILTIRNQTIQIKKVIIKLNSHNPKVFILIAQSYPFILLINNTTFQYLSFHNSKMSVYSGFATRAQQNKYNFLLETLVVALKKRILKFYKQEEADENKFKLLIKKIYKKMYLLEKGKFMTPKYTTCFTDLIESLSIQINYDSMSDVSSSMMSQTFSLKKQRQNTSANEMEDETLKSRNILQSKRNLLEAHRNHSTTINLSALSLKKPYFNTLNVDNQEQSSRILQNNPINRSNSLGVDQQSPLNVLKQKIKLRKLQDLKSLRGTVHMPKVQDFLPKKQEIEPGFFRRPMIMEQPQQREHKGGYRRQKYSRADVNIQEL